MAVAKVSFSKLHYLMHCYSFDYQGPISFFTSDKECYIFAPIGLNSAMNRNKNFFPSLLPFNVFFGKWRAILALISFAILALIKMLR
ncbi:hypothetical protein CWM47_17660 [Spirosoma pollinicola]|uniref:Uncharacterized protein n=1 Tax=Spirosoma pollinicola TaxID=2057025 RepID=A0A2K8Z0X3_9BACT|nr:hypothetical protein CWM47_17660 [Spirosoma pollinicola]